MCGRFPMAHIRFGPDFWGVFVTNVWIVALCSLPHPHPRCLRTVDECICTYNKFLANIVPGFPGS